MSGVFEIESAIARLPADDYEKLLSWWTEHHLSGVKQPFESPALEQKLLDGLAGEASPLNEEWLNQVRARTRAALAS